MSKWILVAMVFGFAACDSEDDYCDRAAAAAAASFEAVKDCLSAPTEETPMTVDECEANPPHGACDNPKDKAVFVDYYGCYAKAGKCTLEGNEDYFEAVEKCWAAAINSLSEACFNVANP